MIIAVTTVRVMEVSVHEVIGVIAMWNSLVAAARTVLVAFVVPLTSVVRSTAAWMFSINFKDAFIYMLVVNAVKMAVMNVIEMVAVAHGFMAAILAVGVRMIRMGAMIGFGMHSSISLCASQHTPSALDVAITFGFWFCENTVKGPAAGAR